MKRTKSLRIKLIRKRISYETARGRRIFNVCALACEGKQIPLSATAYAILFCADRGTLNLEAVDAVRKTIIPRTGRKISKPLTVGTFNHTMTILRARIEKRFSTISLSKGINGNGFSQKLITRTEAQAFEAKRVAELAEAKRLMAERQAMLASNLPVHLKNGTYVVLKKREGDLYLNGKKISLTQAPRSSTRKNYLVLASLLLAGKLATPPVLVNPSNPLFWGTWKKLGGTPISENALIKTYIPNIRGAFETAGVTVTAPPWGHMGDFDYEITICDTPNGHVRNYWRKSEFASPQRPRKTRAANLTSQIAA